MRLKVTLQRRGTEKPVDIMLDADAGTTVGHVARVIMATDPRHASVPPEGADDVSLRVVTMNGTERVVVGRHLAPASRCADIGSPDRLRPIAVPRPRIRRSGAQSARPA